MKSLTVAALALSFFFNGVYTQSWCPSTELAHPQCTASHAPWGYADIELYDDCGCYKLLAKPYVMGNFDYCQTNVNPGSWRFSNNVGAGGNCDVTFFKSTTSCDYSTQVYYTAQPEYKNYESTTIGSVRISCWGYT